jgi:pre-mRNA-splicing factor ATP-dependent RNA helicase DHX15/PRP43
MADRVAKRASADYDEASNKKTKMDARDGKANPYLAHMYEEENNGWGSNEPAANSPLAGMKRRQTSAQQHTKVEDLDSNPFTGRQHSQKYFQILQTRRELPVHKQRYVSLPATHHTAPALFYIG